MTPDQIHQHAEAIAQQLAEARERLDQANDELWMLRRIALDQTQAPRNSKTHRNSNKDGFR